MSRRFFGRIAGAFSDYFSRFGKGLFVVSLLLSAIGLAAVNTATLSSEAHVRHVIVQSAAVVIGVIAVFVLSKMDYALLGQFVIPIVVFSFLILLYTAFFGTNIAGNTNWIRIGSFTFQPSEFTKIAFVLTFSTHLAQVRETLNRLATLMMLFVHFSLYAFPIVLQGDYGSLLIYAFLFAALLYLSGLKYRYLILAAVVLVASAPLLWNFVLKDYHKKRILFSLNPELDPLNFGYQPLLSRIAVGSGGLTGMGYGKGVQAQNDLLPEGRTDFIFSIIGEETGFIGCMTVIVLMSLLIFFFLRARRGANDDAGRLICCGFAVMFAVQSLINIGMCIGISPVIGVTLPFISSGGTSVLTSFLAVGMAESVLMKQERSLRFGTKRKT